MNPLPSTLSTLNPLIVAQQHELTPFFSVRTDRSFLTLFILELVTLVFATLTKKGWGTLLSPRQLFMCYLKSAVTRLPFAPVLSSFLGHISSNHSELYHGL